MSNLATHSDRAPGFRGIKFNWDWITRPLFGGALACLAVAAIFGGTLYVAIFSGAAGVAAAREWHRMVIARLFGPDFFVTSTAIIVSLAAELAWPGSLIPWAAVLAGALVSLALAAARGEPALWQGAASLYLGAPLLTVLLLRDAPHGAWIVVGLFIAVWATDTGALIVGNLVGGPRLWPSLSPNKTWAGTLGGVAAASLAEAGFVAFLGGHFVPAAALGAAISLVAHCGDLFESWAKRTFQRKDSGSMIPGHGGVLDRIDSTLAAAPFLAVLVLIAGVNPLFGAHP